MDCKIGFQLSISLLVVVLVGRCEALWFSWGSIDGTTEAPSLDNEGSGNPVTSNESPTPENIEEVGADIIEIESGIHKFAQTWNQNAKATEAPKLTTVRSKARNERPMEKGAGRPTSRGSKPDEIGVSLLQLIGDPPPDEITKIYGPDNSPGYVFGPDANTGQLARAHLPSPFYRDFSLLFNLKPQSTKGGVIFSVTDASQKIMYVGVKLSPVKANKQNVIFYYTEPDSQVSYVAATFPVHNLANQWNRFSISVLDDKVTFYINCDDQPQVVRFERSPDEMALEAGAGVFVGQAGGADPDKFLGVIGELRVVGNPRAAERQCEEEGDDSDVASGDGGSGDVEGKLDGKKKGSV